MKKIFIFLAGVSAIFAMSGCAADPEVFAEVFQQKENEKIYTAYNIWYTDPESISCLNIQQGAFIPVGTEIEPIGTSTIGNFFGTAGFNEKIMFRDKSGTVYTIKFNDGYRLCSMRDYMFYTFTKKDRSELFKGVSPQVQRHILRGEVVRGMSEREVKLCYGPPPAIRTPDLRSQMWMYWLSPTETLRVNFRGGKVSGLLNYNPR
ncbi:MAG: hypothetical protein J6S24_09505 [Lentisphaeria bacterium]|nr:hypothetical protein [Lentisphaeria bacterium]MBO5900096.1 hypothetical protein [Lentisphaeria bacterium]MBO5990850.1 hypothetical protein [Lentisphaeria bacterium]MBO7153542.1 hypothetical protein [Lentisphaeria bacterium]